MINLFLTLAIILSSIFLGYLVGKFRNKANGEEKKMLTPEPQKTSTEESLIEKTIMLEESIVLIEKLSQSISVSFSLTGLAQEVVRFTTQILNTEICVLLLLNKDTNTLTSVASLGIREEFANAINIAKGEEISGVVAQFSELIVLNELEKQAQAYKLKFDTCYKNSLVSMPLFVKNNVLGVLNISNRKTGKPFSPTDVEIIKIIALESAVALQNLKLLEEQQENYLNTIFALASALDARDPYTYWHSKNVTKYSVRIAQKLGLPAYITENIKKAGLLHDIGKIGIRDTLLMKAGKLTDEEFNQIKMHPVKGEEIIKPLGFLQEIAKIVRHHHERFDGKGYPDSIEKENIELGARILAVADSFDATTTDRPYRKALTLEEAKNELMKNKGTQFDPALVDCFLQILERDPAIFCGSETI